MMFWMAIDLTFRSTKNYVRLITVIDWLIDFYGISTPLDLFYG